LLPGFRATTRVSADQPGTRWRLAPLASGGSGECSERLGDLQMVMDFCVDCMDTSKESQRGGKRRLA